MTKYEMILLGWNIGLSAVMFIHALKFALVQRILNQMVAILEARARKSKIDDLMGR